MKYALIQRHRCVGPVPVQCRVLKVSVAGCHERFVRRASNTQRRPLGDEALLAHIGAIHAQTRAWLRLAAHIGGSAGPWHSCGQGSVAETDAAARLRVRGKPRFKVSTDSPHDPLIAPNPLNRKFAMSESYKLSERNITCIPTDKGWLFPAVVIVLFSRHVVGRTLREDMRRDIVIDALRMTWFKRHPGKVTCLLVHCDRGSLHASKNFRDVLLEEYGISASMSPCGNCWDNTCSETLFGSLEVERLYSTLDYVSPMRFEDDWRTEQPRQASA